MFPPPNEENLLTHQCTDLNENEDIIANYIEVQDQVKPVRNKSQDYHPLDKIVQRNLHKGSSHCMKIMGYVTYFAHKWVDKVFLKKHSKCKHTFLCECKQKLLANRKIDRPFVETPIREPQIIEKRLVTDEDTLI